MRECAAIVAWMMRQFWLDLLRLQHQAGGMIDIAAPVWF